MKQQTLKKEYRFEGRGLHTGLYSHLTLKPADQNSGIKFVRTDLGVEIPALAEYVTNTSRCTLISKGDASVSTIEHLMSALTGLGVDNALIEVDNGEVPILDGSARYFVEAIATDGLEVQDADRIYIEIPKEVEVQYGNTGSYIRVEPADHFSLDVTVDFNSRVLGVQEAHWDESIDYCKEVAPCRTFCFLHEVMYLAAQGLVKGGSVDNAIVVVEHPVKDEDLAKLAALFNQPKLEVTPEGYLSNLTLNFPDECGRHKLLDLIGDIRLVGGYPKAHIVAYKPGHTLNTDTAKTLRKLL